MAAKRLLVSLDEEIFNEIADLAKTNQVSFSRIAKELIVSSLALQEDRLFSKIADDRISNTKKWVSHMDAWK